MAMSNFRIMKSLNQWFDVCIQGMLVTGKYCAMMPFIIWHPVSSLDITSHHLFCLAELLTQNSWQLHSLSRYWTCFWHHQAVFIARVNLARFLKHFLWCPVCCFLVTTFCRNTLLIRLWVSCGQHWKASLSHPLSLVSSKVCVRFLLFLARLCCMQPKKATQRKSWYLPCQWPV